MSDQLQADSVLQLEAFHMRCQRQILDVCWWIHVSDTEVKVKVKENVKEADLYSAFIEVPYTQGAQVRITQCYLQTTPYLPLPRKHSQDGASQTEVADI